MSQNLLNGEVSKSQTAAPSRIDLSETLRRLHARSPQESLGVKNDNGLLRASLLAALVVGIVVAGWTTGAYFYDKAFPAPPKAGKPTDTPDAASTTPPPAQPATEGNAAKKIPDPKEVSKTPAKKDIPDALGESGVKKGLPKNPLDGKDDVLKDLK